MLRRVALAAGVASAVDVVAQVWWQYAKTVAGVAAASRSWSLAGFVVVGILEITLPVFYLAVYLHGASLRISRNMRALAMAAAIASGVLLAASVPGALRALQPESILGEAQESKTLATVATALSIADGIGAMLFLLALSRQTSRDAGAAQPARALRAATIAASIATGLIAGGALLLLLLLPIGYSQAGQMATQLGRTPPPLLFVLGDAARSFLLYATIFAAPFIVWRSIRAARAE